MAASIASDKNLDVLMLRYNISDGGSEDDVRPALESIDSRPGTFAFNVTHSGLRGSLASRPSWLGAQNPVPSHADLYQHALDTPGIDVVLAGVTTREQVDCALEALAVPSHSTEYRDHLDSLGDAHREAYSG